MGQCSKELEDCYSEEDFNKFTENSYKVLAQVLKKLEADFSLNSCNNLENVNLPLIAAESGSGVQMPNGVFVGVILILVKMVFY